MLALSHSNSWQRETAFRLLLERSAREVLPLLLEQLPDFQKNAADFREMLRAAHFSTAPGSHLARINALQAIFALAGGRSLETQDKNKIQEMLE